MSRRNLFSVDAALQAGLPETYAEEDARITATRRQERIAQFIAQFISDLLNTGVSLPGVSSAPPLPLEYRCGLGKYSFCSMCLKRLQPQEPGYIYTEYETALKAIPGFFWPRIPVVYSKDPNAKPELFDGLFRIERLRSFTFADQLTEVKAVERPHGKILYATCVKCRHAIDAAVYDINQVYLFFICVCTC
jgi:hypothetical protein